MIFFDLLSKFFKYNKKKYILLKLDFDSFLLILFYNKFKFNNKLNYLVFILIYYTNFFKIIYNYDNLNIFKFFYEIFFLKFLNKNYFKLLRLKRVNLYGFFFEFNNLIKINTINGFKNISLVLSDFFLFYIKIFEKKINIIFSNIILIISFLYKNSHKCKRIFKKIFFYLNLNIFYFLIDLVLYLIFFNISNTYSNILLINNNIFNIKLLTINNNIVTISFILDFNFFKNYYFNNIFFYIIYDCNKFFYKDFYKNLKFFIKKLKFLDKKIYYYRFIHFNLILNNLNLNYKLYLNKYRLIIDFFFEKFIYIIILFFFKDNIINFYKNLLILSDKDLLNYKFFNFFKKKLLVNYNLLKVLFYSFNIYINYLFNIIKKSLLLINYNLFFFMIECLNLKYIKIIYKYFNFPLISYCDFIIYNKIINKIIFINILFNNNSSYKNLLYINLYNLKFLRLNFIFRIYFKVNIYGILIIFIYYKYKKILLKIIKIF